MKKRNQILLSAWIAVFSPIALAGSYPECMLDEMPGTTNAAVFVAIQKTCQEKYPAMYAGLTLGFARGVLGFKNGAACTIKKAKDTPFQPAANNIAMACKCMYDPQPKKEGWLKDSSVLCLQ